MHHRTFTRGLAVTAVGALTLTGLTTTAADAADAPEVSFLSIFNPGRMASTWPERSSGAGAITLTAYVPDPTATVSFEFNNDPAAGDDTLGWAPIATDVAHVGSYATWQWSPLISGPVAVRAVATADEATTYSTRHHVVVDSSATTPSVRVTDEELGYFTQPYADSEQTRVLTAAHGETSATDGTVELSWWQASDGTFQGKTDAAVTEQTKLGSPTVHYGAFDGVLDISAFDLQHEPVLAVAAERESDDVQPVTLYAQTVSSVTTALGTPQEHATPVTVSVQDSRTNPIAGVEVRRLGDGALLGYTDGAGTVTVDQPFGEAVSYYANTTDADAYEEGIDVASVPIDVVAPTRQPRGVVAVLADGPVFDRDEYAEGDIALQLVDQFGKPLAQEGLEVQYSLRPSDAEGEPEVTTGITDEAGRVEIGFDARHANGTYTLDHSGPLVARAAVADESPSTTFTVGDAGLTLTPKAGAAASGGRIAYTGRLAVGDKPLPGRRIDLTYTRGKELAPGLGADAGLSGTTSPLAATVTTGGDGTFTVTVADPAESGRPTETGGRLTAATGETAATPDSPLAGNAEARGTAGAEFGRGPGTVSVRLSGTGQGRRADRITVTSSRSVAGEAVVVYRKLARGGWKKVATRRLGPAGRVALTVPDRNGAAKSSYRATVVASSRVRASTSNVLRLR